MTLYVAGDVHGDKYFDKMTDPALMTLTKDDYVLVLGDLSMVTADEEQRAAELALLESLPYTTLFIDGNHEEFDVLASYPEESWRGGRTRRISPSVRFLMRGQIFEIEGQRLFVMGGAKTFAGLRESGLLTGPDAGIPSDDERAEALANLARCGNVVDLMLTHSAPSNAVPMLPQRENTPTSEFTDWLQGLAETIEYRQWLFGHYHCDAEATPNMRCLLNMLYRVEDGALLREPVVKPEKRHLTKGHVAHADEGGSKGEPDYGRGYRRARCMKYQP